MKKSFLFLLIGLISSFAFSQSLPKKLSGLWEGSDRYIFFDDENPGELVIVLKTYYGWYYDRTAEPDSYSKIVPRDRNAATVKEPEHVFFVLEQLDYTDSWEMRINYSRHEEKLIPFVIIDDKIYLDFYVNNGDVWYGNASSQGFSLDYHPVDENIGSLIIEDGSFFDIRYWRTDMERGNEKAFFSYEGKDYSVFKHVFSAGHLYTCTRGRSKKIRNIVPPQKYDETDFLYNYDRTALVNIKKTSPYLTKLNDKNTFDALMDIIREANSRRKPAPPPLFPVPDLRERQQPINWRAKGLPENFGEQMSE